MSVLIQFADNIDAADAWRFNMPVGSQVAETTDPSNVDQPQAVPADMPRFRTEDRTPGFKLAITRIMRLAGDGFGGTFGLPHGPRQGGPRLRRVIATPPGPIQSERSIGPAGMPAGLVPTRPGYESWLEAGPDSYVGS